MHYLTQLQPDTVADATGSVYTGGILWRLTCTVCFILLSKTSIASPAALGENVYALFFSIGLAEFVVGFIVWEAVSEEPNLETDKGCDLCLSHRLFYASLFAQKAFANIACIFVAFWWTDKEDGWGLRREIVGLRDLIGSRWQGC